MFYTKNSECSRVARESVLRWRMALEHDSRKIDKRHDKVKYTKEK